MKKVGVSHLVYIIIIFIIILSFFLVIAFGGTNNASTMMGTASTVSSLILSVIAIVLSLLDVAGQRESMVDLKETADKLHESNESAAVLTQELMDKIDDLQGLKEEMFEAQTKSDQWIKELLDDMKDLKQKGDFKTEDLEGIIEKANEFMIPNIESLIPKYEAVGTMLAYNTYDIVTYLRRHYKQDDKFIYTHFIRMLKNECALTHSTALKIHKRLSENKYITNFRLKNENYVKLNDTLFKE
jgi:hypothetical protein